MAPPSAVQQLIAAHKEGDKQRASQLARSLRDADVQAALSASANPGELLQAVLSSAHQSDEGEKKRAALLRHTLVVIDESTTIGERAAKNALALVAAELDGLSPTSVAEIVLAILAGLGRSVASVGEVKVHQVLPKCLALLACAESISYADGAERRTAHYAEFQELVLARVCQHEWRPLALLPLLCTLRDIPLTDAQLRVVVRKALRLAAHVELQQKPALVYQLLLLAGRGCKLEVLSGLATHFDALEQQARAAHRERRGAARAGAADEAGGDDGDDGDDDEEEDFESGDGLAAGELLASQGIQHASALDPEELQHVQGTVILNIDLAMRQDHGLGTTLLKMLKSHSLQLSSFSLALLLLLARQPRFEDEALAWLSGAVRSAHREASWTFVSPWLEQAVRPLRAPRVAPLLARITRRGGPEHLLPSVVSLATIWMDAGAAAPGGGGAAGAGASDSRGKATAGALHALGDNGGGPASGTGGSGGDDDESAHAMSAANRLARLGANTLVEVFRNHDAAQAEVLELLLARVAARAPSCERWVELLERLTRTVPHMVMGHVPRLRETLAYAAHLPPDAGAQLFAALLPLCSHRLELRDALVLALRKAAFQRDEGARLVAVRGFLLLLAHARDGGGAASSSAAPGAAPAPSQSDAEMLGFVKRCLSHQPAVRARLYAGLPQVAEQRPHLRRAVHELLCAHLAKYHEPDRSSREVLRLSECVALAPSAVAGRGVVAAEVEPLGLLMRSLVAVESGMPDGGAPHGPAEPSVLADIFARVRASKAADFGFVQGIAFDAAGEENVLRAHLLQGACVTLAEAALGARGAQLCPAGAGAVECAASFLALHAEIGALLKTGGAAPSKGAKGGGGGTQAAGGSKSFPSVDFPMALSACERLLQLAHEVDGGGGGAESAAGDGQRDVALLRAPGGGHLLRFAVSSAMRALQASGASASARGAHTRSLLPLLFAEAEKAVARAVESALAPAAKDARVEAAGAAADAEPKTHPPGGGGKEGGAAKDGPDARSRESRPYAALTLDALEALVRAAPDRSTLAQALRAAGAAEDGGAQQLSGASARRTEDAARCAPPLGRPAQETAGAAVSEALRTRAEHMLASLLGADSEKVAKEAEACLRLVRALAARLPAELAASHAAWAEAQCKTAPRSSMGGHVPRLLVAHWLALPAQLHVGSSWPALKVLEDARFHLGVLDCGAQAADGEDEDIQAAIDLEAPPFDLELMHEGNANAMLAPALDALELVLGEIERALVVLKRVLPPGGGALAHAAAEDGSADEEDAAPHPALELQRATLDRLLGVVAPLSVLTSARIGSASLQRALRLLEKGYRVLTTAFTLAPAITPKHEQLAKLHWQKLSRNIYRVLTYMTTESEEPTKERATQARAKREGKLVPALVFRIEQFEALLVKRSGKREGIDLVQGMKRSTARDFKIDLVRLESEQLEKEKENAEKAARPKKKAKRTGKAAADEAEPDAMEDVDE